MHKHLLTIAERVPVYHHASRMRDVAIGKDVCIERHWYSTLSARNRSLKQMVAHFVVESIPAMVILVSRCSPPALLTSSAAVAVLCVSVALAFRRRPARPARSPARAPAPKVGFTEARLAALGRRVDCVVIGSGPGGLACASALAQRGKAVLVLEASRVLISGGNLVNFRN